jgi:hypothetical protein
MVDVCMTEITFKMSCVFIDSKEKSMAKHGPQDNGTH